MFETAYREQERLVARLVSAGDCVRGWKIGATSGAVRARLKTSEPFYAVLLQSHFLPGEAVGLGAGWAEVLVECEIAFVLERHLEGPGVTPRAVRERVAEVRPAFDVIGLAHGDPPEGAADVIRSNGSCAGVVLGATGLPVSQCDPAEVEVVLRGEGCVMARGAGAEVMGDPCAAVAWLANRLAQSHQRIMAGQVVLSGSMAAATAVAGDALEADFGRLGRVTLRVE